MAKKPKKEIKLSATRIGTFLQCKQRYWYNYIERLTKPDNPSFKLGLACHGSLEHAGNVWKDKELTEFSDDQIEEILKVYDETSVKEGLNDYADHVLGRELTLSRLKNFSIGQKIVGVEDRFGFPDCQDIETSDGIKLIGAIDKTIEIDEDTVLIVDYKTSKFVPDTLKLKHDVQLSMYHLVAKKLYPQYKRIILSLDMLRKGEIIYTYRTDEEIDEFEKYLTAVHKEMSEIEESTVKPNLNMLCGWCDYVALCPSYQEFINSESCTFAQASSLSDSALIEEWTDIRVKKKLYESREKELTAAIMDKIQVQECTVASDTEEAYIRQNARTTYSARDVSRIIPVEDLPDLVTISPTKLKKYMDINPSIRPHIEEVAETNFTSAFLATRKVKVEKPKKETKKKVEKKAATKKKTPKKDE